MANQWRQVEWWEGLSREQLEATAQAEAPRMSASRIGQWLETRTALDAPLRQRQMAREVPTGHGGDA